MRILSAMVGPILLLLAGCAAAPSSHTVDLWATHQGGVIDDFRQLRAQTVARPLIAACHGRPIRIQILATDAVCAFSWPSGRVFVTRGLIDRLDDQELAAVIAHELGHLLSDGQLQTLASLRGSCVDPDREVRADTAGVALLRTMDLSPDAMVTMLRKVEKYGSLPPNCRAAMDRRIAILIAAHSADPMQQAQDSRISNQPPNPSAVPPTVSR